MIKVGDRLKNGATVGATVLAIKERPNGGQNILCWWLGEYVSWIVNENEPCSLVFFHGQNFKRAAKEFEEL